MQKDSAQIKGIVNLVLRDKEGRVKQHKTIRNLVTDYGLAHIVGRLIDPHQDITGKHKVPRMMSHMALGVGAGVTASDTATATQTFHRMLENEVGTRVQVKRDTTFNSEYSTFSVAFAPNGSFTYGANGSNVIRVLSTIANAEFIRAAALVTEPHLMTVEESTHSSIPAGTTVQSITTEAGGVLAIQLGTAVSNANGFDGTNTVNLTFTPVQSQYGRIFEDTGAHETTVDFSGGGSLVGTLNKTDIGGTRGIVGGYYNTVDNYITGTDLIPPFFGDADDVPNDSANNPFTQFGTAVDGVFQGTIAGSSVIQDSGVDPEGYPTGEHDYSSATAPTDTVANPNALGTAVAGTKKSGKRIVYVATFKASNPALGSGLLSGLTEAPIKEAGIFNKAAKDSGHWQYYNTASVNSQTSTNPNTSVATAAGGSVLMNAEGATGAAITQSMLCRTTFSVVNKATDDTLQITWSVQLKDTATP
jgi:hypothetical protein